jgi:hypothetical protein
MIPAIKTYSDGRIDLYFRVQTNNVPITLTFLNEDGDPYSLAYEDFEIRIKNYEGARKNQILLESGSGLTINENAITFALTDEVTDIKAAEYYWELFNITNGRPWLTGKAYGVLGVSPSIEGSTEFVINEGGTNLTITISEGTGGGLSTVVTDGVTVQGDGSEEDPIALKIGTGTASKVLYHDPGTGEVKSGDAPDSTVHTDGTYITGDGSSGDPVSLNFSSVVGDLGTAAMSDIEDFDPAGEAVYRTGLLQSELEALISEKADQDSVREKLDALITPQPKSGNYTLASGDLSNVDLGKNLKFVQSTSGDLTVPTNASVAFPIGTILGVEGFDNVIADTGVTITGTRGDLTIPSGTTAALEKTGTNTWTLHNGTADSGGGSWGGIDGDIEDQTDLVAYIEEELTAKGDALVTTVSKTASYIFGTDASDLTDVNAGKDVIFEMNVASANTFTIPLDSTTNFPIGTVRGIRQTGAGQTTVDKAVGVTLNGPLNAFKLAAQGAIAFIEKTAANTWYINGETVI